MQFTDLTFLLIFMPILLLVYYISKEEYRPYVLVAFSLLFYACGSPQYFLLLCGCVVVDVLIAGFLCRMQSKEKFGPVAVLLLVFGILINLSVLGYYKYYDFVALNLNRFLHTQIEAKALILPLGISFFTFKAISLLIDAYKGKFTSYSMIQTVNYLTFFGQIQSGPIARFSEFKSLAVGKERQLASDGAVRFMIGFAKKVLLANVLSNITTEIFADGVTLSTSLAWLGAVCYSLQLYYDFSGYSDMAIGICNMLGYGCPENFNYPYATKSVSEFWRRWHITLGGWFRDYIYIPLGGSRVGKARLYFNLFVVWFLTGLWHGANWNFIVWGLGYFVVIAVEKAFGLPEKFHTAIGRTIWRIVTLLFVNFQWVMFRCNSFGHGIYFIKTMCTKAVEPIADARARFLFGDYIVYIVIAIVLAAPIVPLIKKKCENNVVTKRIYDIVSGIVIIACFVVALAFVIGGQNSPFLYGNF